MIELEKKKILEQIKWNKKIKKKKKGQSFHPPHPLKDKEGEKKRDRGFWGENLEGEKNNEKGKN